MVIALFSVASFAERVEDLPAKPADYVSDYAHVLSPETIARLGMLCGQLDHSKTNTQVAIVTLNNINGDDKADFANRLEEKWKVGKKGSDRSVLILVTVQDRHYWLEVGYGLEGILPDAKVGDIGRMMVPDLKAHDYDGAITIGLTQIANVVAADAHVTLNDPGQQGDESAQPIRQRQPGPHLTVGVIFRIIFFLLVIVILVVRVLGRFGLFFLGGPWLGGGGGFGGGGWGGGGGGGGGGGDGFGGFGGGRVGRGRCWRRLLAFHLSSLPQAANIKFKPAPQVNQPQRTDSWWRTEGETQS